ncbi:energy transducer TonB [Sphingomonas baiyangensis]|uniref:Energy transducer TonB n=1 Tax=Sphingomonas baiyangensis TaxID=2572576 RepID=A0A4V5PWU3_9SPHN|nr:energy transducer TonB [Sphingomonas baiyangensis]TKD52878.1 energy transducer TonB [Sphingomonas baiyangensis]
MAYQALRREQRAGSAAAALLVTGALGWALVNGLSVEFQRRVAESLAVFGVAPEPPPPPPVELEPNPVRDDRPEGEAAPPNIRSRPTELVAPPPVLPLPPPPVIVAEKAGPGADATQGSADIVGPGTGAGGVGDGTGSGGAGDGDGAGGEETPPLWLAGRMRFADLPRSLRGQNLDGRVEVRYLVATNGRIERCEIERSSGNPLLDRSTCNIIRDRFRFEPSRDARGRPVPAWVVESHEWVIETFDEEGRRR